MDLETNTRARRVEPVTTEQWVVVNKGGEIIERTLSKSLWAASEWLENICLDGAEIRKVKLTIEVVE